MHYFISFEIVCLGEEWVLLVGQVWPRAVRHVTQLLSLRPVTVAVGPTGSVLRETLTAPGLQLLAGVGASFLSGHVKASWRLRP